MNKYEEALETIMKQIDILCEDGIFINFRHNNEYFILKELVDKATPKKPIIEGPFIREKDTFCPNCKINICLTPSSKPNFCWCCGQELDWSTDE